MQDQQNQTLSDQPESRRRSASLTQLVGVPAVIAVLFVAAMFVSGMMGVEDAGLRPVSVWLGLCSCVGVLVFFLALKKAIPPLVVVMMFGLAYAPGAPDALIVGIRDVAAPVDTEWALSALLILIVFLAGSSLVSAFVASRPLLKMFTRSFVNGICAGRDRLTPGVLYAFLAISAVVSFETGQWSYWGGHTVEREAGFRFELLYEPLLLGGIAIAGRHIGRALLGARMAWMRMGPQLAIYLVITLLIFLHQSRRIMIGGILLSTLDPVLSASQGTFRQLPRARIAAAGVFAVCLTAAVFYGSYAWRHSRTEDTMGWQDEISVTTQNMATGQFGADDAAKEAAGRFTYLWIDAVSAQQLYEFRDIEGLYDVFLTSVVSAIPGSLLPEKYQIPVMTCERAFEALNFYDDLSCTPISEGLIFGGAFGFALTVFVFGVGLGMAVLLYQTGTEMGVSLASCLMATYVVIETSAFPIVHGLRMLVIVGGLLVPGCWLAHFVLPDHVKGKQSRQLTRPGAALPTRFSDRGAR